MSVKTESIVTIIPARGGSKGLPRKNILCLGNRPLIAWTIQAALDCQELENIIVSTDDQEVAEIARQWGAGVPFMRPVELAGDDTSVEAVVFHLLEWFEYSKGFLPEVVCLLQPTSPLRTGEDISKALELMHIKNANAVVSVTPNPRPVQWLRRLGADGKLMPYCAEQEIKQRQKAEPLFLLNGAIYLIKTDLLLKGKTFYPEGAIAYTMPLENSIDIDTELDFIFAEALLDKRLRL
jgi:CMP-N-acetylneuraminic acid synthetase